MGIILFDSEKQFIDKSQSKRIKLPEPKFDGVVSIEQALLLQRSVREYSLEPLNLQEISQLLWAAQGITEKERKFRTTPSAGALYPLEVYVVIGKSKDLIPGVYKYLPESNEVLLTKLGDVKNKLTKAALEQECLVDAPVVIVISTVFKRTTQKYGNRGIRYVYMEAGHSAQNVYLQAVSLNLGVVAIGAFDDDSVRSILGLSSQEVPLYLMSVGRKK